MSLGKDKTKIKLFGGEHLYFKSSASGSSWLDLGELANDVKIPDLTTTVEIVGNAGNAFDMIGVRKVNLIAKLHQTGKDEWEMILDSFRGVPGQLYYYNGIVGSVYDEFYAPDVLIMPSATHDTSGKPMTYDVNISIRPTAAIVTGAHTILPSVRKATASFTGVNVFYARIATTVV